MTEVNKTPVGVYISLEKPLFRPNIEESKDLKKSLEERELDWESIKPCKVIQVGSHIGINNLNIIMQQNYIKH